jgi:hypothetical protein
VWDCTGNEGFLSRNESLILTGRDLKHESFQHPLDDKEYVKAKQVVHILGPHNTLSLLQPYQRVSDQQEKIKATDIDVHTATFVVPCNSVFTFHYTCTL